MKKLLLTVGLVVGSIATTGGYSFAAKSQDSNNLNSSKQATDYFMLSLLSDKVNEAVSNYYKEKVSIGNPDSIFIKYGQYTNISPVQVFISEKGNRLKNSFVVKVNVMPQKNGILGKDTITFGVETKGDIQIRMLDYKHTALEDKK
ncbi:DUF3888 domain-containing protein [Rummeliibacillus suwonensis]|uniref:DUF3888 domain-containing protein n=1 Tax=Rummeliibacillus suwonensis TaxID=1306154 RepID=UPI001AAF0BB9|nr:DUF3888 domain-containing protein [Rummeliibacillus suwonensis]MBO2536471.1 DUF3888 domain-containing protein [Rummeliibacillus suwonensis]